MACPETGLRQCNRGLGLVLLRGGGGRTQRTEPAAVSKWQARADARARWKCDVCRRLVDKAGAGGCPSPVEVRHLATQTLARRRSVLPSPLRLSRCPSVVAWTSGLVRTFGSRRSYTAATERGGTPAVRTFYGQGDSFFYGHSFHHWRCALPCHDLSLGPLAGIFVYSETPTPLYKNRLQDVL